MRGSRQVLVKVVLFQLRGPGQPQDDATPNFFSDSKGPMLGLSNEVSFVSELYQEDGQNNKSVFIQNALPKQKWQPLQKWTFWRLEPQLLSILIPPEVKFHIILHLKFLISNLKHLTVQEHGSIFTQHFTLSFCFIRR